MVRLVQPYYAQVCGQGAVGIKLRTVNHNNTIVHFDAKCTGIPTRRPGLFLFFV
jgi:hypothetical protein